MPKIEKTGIIILAHGSKLKKANGALERIVEIAKRRLSTNEIVTAYLQFSKATLSKAAADLARKGCGRIVVVPFFLFAGNHVNRDIPKALEKEKVNFPEIDFIYTENMGKDRRLVEILIDRIKKEISLWSLTLKR